MEVICSSSFSSLFFSPTSYKLNSKIYTEIYNSKFSKDPPRGEEIFKFFCAILMRSPNNPMKRDSIFFNQLALKFNFP